MQERVYNSVDLMKFVMALCVVTIHTSYFDTIEPDIVREPLIALIRSAVPFFFMVSGYFMVKKTDKPKEVKKYVLKILKLYLIWSVITMAYGLTFGGMQVGDIGSVLYRIAFRGYVHLWYMWGLILVIPAICWLALKGIKPWLFVAIAMTAYVFNRAYTHYGSMENPDVIWQWAVYVYQGRWFGVTWLCLAITYLSLGCFYALTDFRLRTWMSVCLILSGMFMMHFEQEHSSVALGVPVIAFGLFPLIRDWRISGRAVTFTWLRNMSSLIYYIHAIIISVVVSIIGTMCFCTWIIIIIVCIITCALLLWLKDKKGFGWLKLIM